MVRIYKFSVEQDSRALYVSTNLIGKLHEFYTVLSQFTLLTKKVDKIFGSRSSLTSSRLKTLLNYTSNSQKNDSNSKKVTSTLKRMTIDSDSEEEAMEVDQPSESSNEGILPDLRQILSQFEKICTWKNIGNKKVPEPVKGISQDYDMANKRIEDIKKQLQKCLED